MEPSWSTVTVSASTATVSICPQVTHGTQLIHTVTVSASTATVSTCPQVTHGTQLIHTVTVPVQPLYLPVHRSHMEPIWSTQSVPVQPLYLPVHRSYYCTYKACIYDQSFDGGCLCVFMWEGGVGWCVCVCVSLSPHLAGLVVKASASGVEDPVRIQLAMGFSPVESYQWLKNWHSSGYPARHLALYSQRRDWSVPYQYTVTGWGRKFDLQLLSQCGST